jgi:hypothetical protein
MAKAPDPDAVSAAKWFPPLTARLIPQGAINSAMTEFIGLVRSVSPGAADALGALTRKYMCRAGMAASWQFKELWVAFLDRITAFFADKPALRLDVRVAAAQVPYCALLEVVQPATPPMFRTAVGCQIWKALERKGRTHLLHDFSPRVCVLPYVDLLDVVVLAQVFARVLTPDGDPAAAACLSRAFDRQEAAADAVAHAGDGRVWIRALVALINALGPIVEAARPRLWEVLCALAMPAEPDDSPVTAENFAERVAAAEYDLGEQDMQGERPGDDQEYVDLIDRHVERHEQRFSAFMCTRPPPPPPAAPFPAQLLARLVVRRGPEGTPAPAAAAMRAEGLPRAALNAAGLAVLFGLFDARPERADPGGLPE